MRALRILIRDLRGWALALLVLALCIRAAVPSGFMVAPDPVGERVLTATVCAAATGGARIVHLVIPAQETAGKETAGKDAPPAKAKDGDCLFASLLQPATGPLPAALLAIALAAIIALGFAPRRLLLAARQPYLRPPLRGPPALI